MKTCLIVRAVTAFNDPILPWGTAGNPPMAPSQCRYHSFKGGLSFGMGRVGHREHHGIVSYHQEKRGQPCPGASQHIGYLSTRDRRMDFRILHTCPQMDYTHLVFPLPTAANSGQLLNVHLYAMIADRDRTMVAFFWPGDATDQPPVRCARRWSYWRWESGHGDRGRCVWGHGRGGHSGRRARRHDTGRLRPAAHGGGVPMSDPWQWCAQSSVEWSGDGPQSGGRVQLVTYRRHTTVGYGYAGAGSTPHGCDSASSDS